MSSAIFVLDTNCLISAGLLRTSINRKAYEKAFREGVVVYSSHTLNEYETIFLKPKFDKYLPLEERKNLITLFKQNARHISTSLFSIKACRDPKDNMFLELAIAVKASCIISGDEDLRVLHPFRGIPILNAPDFLSQF